MQAEKQRHEIPGQFRHEDMLLGDFFPVKNILRVQAMELEPTDVVVASYPKTGTTLLQEIVWLIRNNGDTDKANEKDNVLRVPFMEINYGDKVGIFANLPYPRHMKTHVPYRYLPKPAREGRAKVVYSIRNPKDVLVSYYHFHRMNAALGRFTGTWDDFFDYFRENDYTLCFGNLFDHMKGYWEHKNDENLFIVFFEDMIRQPEKTVKEIAKFLGCHLTEETVKKIVAFTKFDAMKENPKLNSRQGSAAAFDPSISLFMRKGQIGDWKNYFNEAQMKIMDEMEKDKLDGTDLRFISE